MNVSLFDAFSSRPNRLYFARIAADLFPKSADVLEIGCGDGRGAAYLSACGCQVTAMDRDPHVYESAKADCPQVNFICGDAEYLPFASKQFDGVLCEASFSSVLKKESAAAEICRVLKLSGVLVICDYVLEKDMSDSAKPPALSGALTDHGYRRLFREAGFEICEALEQRAFLVSLILHLCKVFEKPFGELMTYLGTAQEKYGFKMYVMKKREGFL